MDKPIAGREEHRRAVERLLREDAPHGDVAAISAEIEAIVRFELENRVPESERLRARLRLRGGPPAGRTAIISDIHGNQAGLEAALRDIEAQGCDRIVCLGDLVDGGPENEGVVAMLRERGIACVRGNHDEYNDIALADETRRFLEALPEYLVEGDILYTHISPRPIKRRVNHEVEAWNVFDETSYRVIFVGHAHVPMIFGKRSAAHGEATRHAFEYNRPFALSDADSYIVCVGSIGYGRDAVGRIRYGIHDTAARTVELRAIDGPLLRWDYALRG